MKPVGTFQKHSFPCVFPGACSDTSILCVSYSLPLLLPHKPRDDLALCTVQKQFCALLGILLSCGRCFSKNPNTKDAASLSQSGQKRHDIFHSFWTIYYTFGISQCAEHPDTNSLTLTAHSNTHILKIAQQTTVTYGREL